MSHRNCAKTSELWRVNRDQLIPLCLIGHRARFRFDPNSIPMGSGNAHHLFYGYAGASTLVLRLEFRCNGGACPSGEGSYQLQAELVNSSSTWTSTGWFTLTDAPHNIEFDWQRSASGSLTLWIDGAQQADLTGVNNSNRVMDMVRLGPVNGIDTGTRGTYFLDSFDSRRYNYLGGQPQRSQTILVRFLDLFAGDGQTDSMAAPAPANLAASLSATPWATSVVHWAATSHRLAKPSVDFVRSQQPSVLSSNGELVTTVITYTYDALTAICSMMARANTPTTPPTGCSRSCRAR